MRAQGNEVVRGLRGSGRGVGAFNVILLEHAEAVVAGAQDAGLPVVVQISQNAARYHGSLAPLALACLRLADEADVPVLVHLDHVEDEALVEEGLALGVPSVMFDAAALPYAENVARTAAVTASCHAAGVWVEAELGEVGGKDGAHAPGVRTDPSEATAFVEATGVDALAVAVGSSHAMAGRDAVLDGDLISALSAAVDVPLVLHGSSGVPDAGIADAIARGIVKVNVGTRLNQLLTDQVRRTLLADPALSDPRKYLAPGRTAVRAEVARLLRLFAGGA